MLEHATTLDIIRHGKPVGGEIFRGKTDVVLSDEGWQQMQQTCERNAEDWQYIISSPMQRCLAFAEQIAEQKNIHLKVDQAIKELSFGDWDGQPIATIAEQQGELLRNYWQDPFAFTPPNAEAMQDFYQRVSQGVDNIVQQHRGKHLLLVSHGGVIRIILSHFLQLKKCPYYVTMCLMRH